MLTVVDGNISVSYLKVVNREFQTESLHCHVSDRNNTSCSIKSKGSCQNTISNHGVNSVFTAQLTKNVVMSLTARF